MTYSETIQYLESFINYEKISSFPYKKSLKLKRIKDFLKTLNNPQDALKCIHIAGTKGKGSTCAFIAHVLREAGYKTGLYTSPHLSDFRERIRILGQRTECRAQSVKNRGQNTDFEGMISRNELSDLVTRLRPLIEKFNKASKYGPITFFEIYTVLAFLYFKEKKVDFAVLETGLGGRLDATNVVEPLTAAITPISYEHTQKLGNSLREIAEEKAGIIKVGRQLPFVISAPQEIEAMEVIRSRCKQLGIKLYTMNEVLPRLKAEQKYEDITYQKTKNNFIHSPRLKAWGRSFIVKGIYREYPNLKIRLLGKHQLVNASVAIGVAEALRNYAINISVDSIRRGLYNTLWPGRCEVISYSPLIVLDGAQNIASIKALKQAIKENFQYNRLILVLGISNDKDIKGICSEMYNFADEIVLTKANNPRAIEPKILAKYFNGKKAYITDNVQEAKTLVCRIAKKGDLILVCGSLFVVGEAREVLSKSSKSRGRFYFSQTKNIRKIEPSP
ncbi:MAG: folylpolyglutamate synthase/dihydrofolate synthase family protein [Candidatus Omnitrophota bacterium]|nr:folylpolyglutamate synthase/dihydrofolate synthase family protein [Candidatus Omnitrophota bacterium]